MQHQVDDVASHILLRFDDHSSSQIIITDDQATDIYWYRGSGLSFVDPLVMWVNGSYKPQEVINCHGQLVVTQKVNLKESRIKEYWP